MAPVFVDGVKTVTLKGERIAEDFHRLVENYVASHYGPSAGQAAPTCDQSSRALG